MNAAKAKAKAIEKAAKLSNAEMHLKNSKDLEN